MRIRPTGGREGRARPGRTTERSSVGSRLARFLRRGRAGFRATAAVWLVFAGIVAAGAKEPPALEWDAVEKSYTSGRGETEAVIPFTVMNRSAQPVEMRSAATSCHCTSVEFPREPWVLAPGASDTLHVRVDLRSRRGGLNKTIYLETSAGEEILLVHVQIPPPPAVQREMNREFAQADRQAVLRGDCATCHVAPAAGKHGAELFAAMCLVCHGASPRAEMVPDLMKPTVHRDAAYWTKWIREGGPKTLMPAFARENGGPLDRDQVESLVAFLTASLPAGPVAN